jgi:hypothetical protein
MRNIVPLGLLFVVVFLMLALGVLRGDFDAASASVESGALEREGSPDDRWRRCQARCAELGIGLFVLVGNGRGVVSSCDCEGESLSSEMRDPYAGTYAEGFRARDTL